MKGIILAAGRGSRMGDLTSNLPKCRTVIFGKELIQWQLDALTSAGVEDISIVRGYLNKTFEFKVNYFDNKRWADTNMVSTLISANKWLKAETNIISYADIVYSKSSISMTQTGRNYGQCALRTLLMMLKHSKFRII